MKLHRYIKGAPSTVPGGWRCVDISPVVWIMWCTSWKTLEDYQELMSYLKTVEKDNVNKS